MVVKRSPSSAVTTTTNSIDSIFERFEIEFDAGSSPVFHGGELITGSLKIQLKKEVTINAIRIQFRGRAVFLDLKHPTKEAGEKVYFDKNFILLERPPGHPEPGHFPWSANFLYSLPFECPLPKGCETSYEGPYGFIRYYARAILEIAEPDNAKYIVKQCFSIVSSPELHQLVSPITDPISEKKTVKFGSCCCRGKMTAEILLPKSSYAPGEDIIGNFTMDSSTAKNALEHIEVRLIDRLQRITSDLDPIKSSTPQLIDQVNGLDTKITEKKQQKKKEKQGKNGTSGGDVVVDSKEKEETSKKQKKTPQTTTKPSPSTPSSTEKHRVVFGRRLVKDDFKGETTSERRNNNEKNKNFVTKTNVNFLRVPAVVPTTQVSSDSQQQQQSASQFDELVDGVDAENGQFHRLLESPSTATLRARREPFLRVNYALQIYLGTHVLVELPIDIHPIPIYAKGIGFQPFAGGAQPVGEPDESSYIPYKGPFSFAPLYPVYLESPKLLIVSDDKIATPVVEAVAEPTVAEPTSTSKSTTITKTTEKPINGGLIKSKELKEEPFIIVKSTTTKEEIINTTPSIGEITSTKTTTIIKEERMTITTNEEDKVYNLNKEVNEIKEKPLELNEEENEAFPEKNEALNEANQLSNGEANIETIEEMKQNGGDSVKKNIVETEEYKLNNEDGSTINVHKTITTTTTTTTTTPTLIINGENYNDDLNGGEHDEQQDDENNKNNNGILDNQQMDVSMSG